MAPSADTFRAAITDAVDRLSLIVQPLDLPDGPDGAAALRAAIMARHSLVIGTVDRAIAVWQGVATTPWPEAWLVDDDVSTLLGGALVLQSVIMDARLRVVDLYALGFTEGAWILGQWVCRQVALYLAMLDRHGQSVADRRI